MQIIHNDYIKTAEMQTMKRTMILFVDFIDINEIILLQTMKQIQEIQL